jgi:hypothetical protein
MSPSFVFLMTRYSRGWRAVVRIRNSINTYVSLLTELRTGKTPENF